MKLIGAGFGRTGTTSTQAALEQLLGRPCYHMEVVLKNDPHLDAWHGLATDGAMDWRSLLADFGACVDFPICLYYEELMALYPDAPVLLTERDPEAWWASWKKLMNLVSGMRFMGRIVPRARRAIQFIDGIVLDPVFGGEMEKDSAIRAYLAHNERVKRTVPSERLLVYEVTQGWEPLCALLDVPVPDTPFPHLASGVGRARQVLEDAFRR
ncbi:MAG: sulfotransferase family protein [Alphaproteobacteria bacterium]|nr:sulfotransferase family protein [Alphaproteobacteria bacterium]